MMTVELKGVLYRETHVTSADEAIDLTKLKSIVGELKDDGQCLHNAYITARAFENNEVICVEGFVHTSTSNDARMIRHCWNKIGSTHFDVTKDFIWAKKSTQGKFNYFPVQEFQHSEYATGQKFLSQAPKIAAEIEQRLTNPTLELKDSIELAISRNQKINLRLKTSPPDKFILFHPYALLEDVLKGSVVMLGLIEKHHSNDDISNKYGIHSISAIDEVVLNTESFLRLEGWENQIDKAKYNVINDI